jgi:hypothetical protein
MHPSEGGPKVGDNGSVSNIEHPDTPAHAEVTIRRAPKFGVFIVGGALLGFIATLVVVGLTQNIDRSNATAITGTTAQDVSFWGQVGYFAIWGITIGGVVGALVAILLDWILGRRQASLVAERYDRQPETETVEGEIDEDGLS